MEKFEPNTFVFDATLLSEFGKPTVLATWLIRDGYGFNAKPIEIDLGGYTVYHLLKTPLSPLLILDLAVITFWQWLRDMRTT